MIQENIQEQVAVGSKKVVAKDFFESTNIPLFTTQKKRILEFAKQKNIPSKFVIPIYEEEISNPTKSDIADDYVTLSELLKVKLDENTPISKIVETVHEKYPTISQREILYHVADLVKLDKNFYKQAEIITVKYKDPESFGNEKINFESIDVPKYLNKDKEDLKQVKSFFQNITKVDPVLTSDMTITKLTVEYDIETANKENLLEMAPDLFANIILNAEVPFIQYNDQRLSKYKVFNGETFETRPPFKLFDYRFSKFEDKNMLYFIVFADQTRLLSNQKDLTKNSYIAAAINLNKGTLSFKYQVLVHRQEKEILDAFKTVLPELKFKNRREKNYGASFNAYYLTIREDSFLDLLLTETFQVNSKNLFSSLLFADEFEKAISEKKKLKLYYDTNIAFDQDLYENIYQAEEISKIASLGFSMTRYLSGVNDSQQSKGRYVISAFDKSVKPEDKNLGIKNTPFKSLLLEPETPYISVNISKAVNRFVLFQFMNIFARLLNVYKEVKDQYEKIYDSLIPALKDQKTQEEDLTLIPYPNPKEEEEEGGKVGLSVIAPEIFTDSYSRDCQYKTQPIIIPDEEVEYWKNQKIKKASKLLERPVLKFADFNFVCPGNVYPFVALKGNLDPDRKYEYFPCCYQKPQKEIRKRQKGTTFRSKDPIKTNKVLAIGGLGNIPTPIDEMIKGGFEKQVNLFRMGTFISPNSFLACILIALQDKQFMKQETKEQKDRYITKIKKAIADSANFNVTSSELFDITNEERIELFLREDDFLDPALFYRVMEEVFGLNIFVFTASYPKPNVETTYTLEVSRFSSVPMHSFKKDAATMLIYKHWGSETDHLAYPQCELIVAGLETIDATLFTSELAQYLLKGYFISSEVFGKLYSPEDKYFQNYSSLTLYKLLVNDFIGKFVNTKKDSIRANGQLIDDKGKLAGIQLQTEEGLKLTMGVPPLCPQDLPIVKKIQKPKLKDVLKLFESKPTGFSFVEDQTVSVWFKLLNMEYGIQIPIEEEPRKTIEQKYNLPEVPENRFILQKRPSQIQRLFKLQKDVNIIIQVVRWLYLLFIKKEKDLTIEEKLERGEEFMEKYLKLKSRKQETDSSKTYDFSELPRRLPSKRDTLPQIFNELAKHSPSFVEEQKLIISGKTFYQRIKASLEHFIRLNLQISIPEYLDEYYQSIYDYPTIPKNFVFLSKIDFDRWLKQAKENPTSSYPVYFSLRGKLYDLNSPYLYAIEIEKPSIKNPFGENFMFLIQNAPYINSKESALENAVNWKNNKINRPEVSRRNISKFNNYKVFTIGQNERFELIEDKTVANKKYETIFILKYPTVDRYASILPMS